MTRGRWRMAAFWVGLIGALALVADMGDSGGTTSALPFLMLLGSFACLVAGEWTKE